ncbi:hypothetical protein F4778DRAFT_785779 [Xylariomycetidae sp. FL2044]|nr:hypothetical protein F4778DRAFT_785779 [Xylariomycetidae sp. FL2044]
MSALAADSSGSMPEGYIFTGSLACVCFGVRLLAQAHVNWQRKGVCEPAWLMGGRGAKTAICASCWMTWGIVGYLFQAISEISDALTGNGTNVPMIVLPNLSLAAMVVFIWQTIAYEVYVSFILLPPSPLASAAAITLHPLAASPIFTTSSHTHHRSGDKDLRADLALYLNSGIMVLSWIVSFLVLATAVTTEALGSFDRTPYSASTGFLIVAGLVIGYYPLAVENWAHQGRAVTIDHVVLIWGCCGSIFGIMSTVLAPKPANVSFLVQLTVLVIEGCLLLSHCIWRYRTRHLHAIAIKQKMTFDELVDVHVRHGVRLKFQPSRKWTPPQSDEDIVNAERDVRRSPLFLAVELQDLPVPPRSYSNHRDDVV